MKDISKINQDIENIKQRGVNKAVAKVKESYKQSPEDPKTKDTLKITESGTNQASPKEALKSDLQKAKAALTKEQLERQRQMSIISFQPHTLFAELKGLSKGQNQMSDDNNFSQEEVSGGDSKQEINSLDGPKGQIGSPESEKKF